MSNREEKQQSTPRVTTPVQGSDDSQLDRCRLILATSPDGARIDALRHAVTGGDVASVILFAGTMAEHDFLSACKSLVGDLQSHGCAVLIADNTQVFGKCGADGLFLEKTKNDLTDAIARFSPHNIVGCGNIKARHNALVVGEAKPDFVFFGKLGGDIKPEAHPKNIALAEWWAELVEIPCVVMGGNVTKSVIEASQTGADFVALDQAIFESANAAEAVAEANRLLDEHAPSLLEEDE